MTRGKRQRTIRNIGIAAITIIAIIIATSAAFYFSNSPTKQTSPTVSNPLAVGDKFTYKLSGSTLLGNPDVRTPSEFREYNDTEHYNVTVTAIRGDQVTLETDWQFKNGTLVSSPQVISLSTGATAQLSVFSYLYPSNLSVNNKLYPQETSGLTVNSTSTQQFAHNSRQIDFWQTEDQFMDTSDQTANTMRYDYIGVNFDRQSGMMVSLTRIEFFTNPQIQLTIKWQLISSNVWTVK